MARAVAVLDAVGELKSDHTKVRDLLLDIIKASDRQNATKALELLVRLDKLGGPHFQWEEESFYPALEKFFGAQYKEYLFGVHDRVIRAARQLAQILGKGEITKKESGQVVSLVRSEIMPHPIECEGLALFAEKLSKRELDKMARHFEQVKKAKMSLLEWADKVRARKVL